MPWVARLIERNCDEVLYLRGEAATIQRWLSALPADLVRPRSRLLLAQAFLAASSGRVEAMEPCSPRPGTWPQARQVGRSSPPPGRVPAWW